MKAIELTGKQFGKLKVIRRDGNRGAQPMWLCKCECGRIRRIFGMALRRGMSKSCGKLPCRDHGVATRTHGESGHSKTRKPEYQVWGSMIQRCTNRNITCWKAYGGRGIKVCRRWRRYEEFLKDMGRRPPNYMLDRINVNGDYEPSNCRWASRSESNANKTTTQTLEQKIARSLKKNVRIVVTQTEARRLAKLLNVTLPVGRV